MFFCNYFYRQFKLRRQLFILRLLIVLTFGISHSAVASPLNSYCISKIKPKQSQSGIQNNSKNQVLQTLEQPITISKDSEKFIIEKGGKGIELKRQKDNKTIVQLDFLQKDEWISYAYLTKDNWLFIHADYNNYMTNLNLDIAELKFKRPSKLPEVYQNKCSRFDKWLFGGCPVSLLNYSPTLDRVFLSGYHPTSSAQEWVTMEIVAGKAKILSSPKTINSFRADLPKFKGVIFEGSSKEVLFYNGSTVTELPVDFPKRWFWSKNPDWRIEGLSDITYNLSTDTPNGRIFIGSLYTAITPKFLFELKTGTSLTPIPLPEELVRENNIGLSLAKLPNDPRLWAIMGNNILAEINGKLKTVITAPKSYIVIAWSQSLSDSTISFQVAQRNNTKSLTTYYIKHASKEAKCEAMLDLEKPLLLDGNKIIGGEKPKF